MGMQKRENMTTSTPKIRELGQSAPQFGLGKITTNDTITERYVDQPSPGETWTARTSGPHLRHPKGPKRSRSNLRPNQKPGNMRTMGALKQPTPRSTTMPASIQLWDLFRDEARRVERNASGGDAGRPGLARTTSLPHINVATPTTPKLRVRGSTYRRSTNNGQLQISTWKKPTPKHTLPVIVAFAKTRGATLDVLERLNRAKQLSTRPHPATTTATAPKVRRDKPPLSVVGAATALQVLGPCLSLPEVVALRVALVGATRAASLRQVGVSDHSRDPKFDGAPDTAFLREVTHRLVCRLVGVPIRMDDLCHAVRASKVVGSCVKRAFAAGHPAHVSETEIGSSPGRQRQVDAVERDRTALLKAIAALSTISPAMLDHVGLVLGISKSLASPSHRVSYVGGLPTRERPSTKAVPRIAEVTPDIVEDGGADRLPSIETVADSSSPLDVRAGLEARRAPRSAEKEFWTGPTPSVGGLETKSRPGSCSPIRSAVPVIPLRPNSAKADSRPPLPHAIPDNPRFLALASRLFEIEPPTGILRVPLYSAGDVEVARARVTDGARLINDDLPRAARALGQPTIGPLFQSLLRRHFNDLDGSNQGAMYASRDDRNGGAEIDLATIAADEADLAHRTVAVVELLRIKLEDDGDLLQASKTLHEASGFFTELVNFCTNEGIDITTSLTQLRF